MKSVFFRRLLIALIVAMLLASVLLVAGYSYFSRNVYTQIKLDEMQAKADAVGQLILEHRHNQMSSTAFINMFDKLTTAAAASIVIINADGSISYYSNTLEGIADSALFSAISEQIATVLAGYPVIGETIKIDRNNEVLLAAEPIMDEGLLVGGVFVIKSTTDIRSAADRLSMILLWLATVVLPVIFLLVFWQLKQMTAPLHDMSEAAIAMSRGNFSIRVNENEVGEIGVLARALNAMSLKLSETIHLMNDEKTELNAILQSLTDGVAVVNDIGELTHYNPELMRMFGVVNVESREELVNDSLIWRAFDEVFISGEPQTITYPMQNEKTLWITISPVSTEEGERTGVVGLFKDMTELERLEAMRREYVANVSHELRTPLTAVRGLLEPLADGMVTNEEDRQRYYKIMLHEVQRLSRLITDMLMLSRLQSGTEYMEFSIVDMEELVNDVAVSYSKQAAEKGIELILDAGNVPGAITDPDRVEQVLIILIDNAMRYTPAGGSITLGLHDGERILVTVRDTGCGIEEKDLPHIFERFYKVDKSRNEGGTGLGLSIAKYIMDKLEETFIVDSIVGEGTCFTFTVKKYNSNAIALGPVEERRIYIHGKKAEQAEEMPTVTDGVVDAPFEVIKEKGSKKSILPRRDD